MINPFKEINWRPDRRDLRKFAWSLIFGFPCIALIFFVLGWISMQALPGPRPFLLVGGIGSLVGLICLLVPVVARPLYYVWYALAGCMGIVMANLLFTLLYYLLFTPVGFLMRLFGRDVLSLKKEPEATSYWKEAPPEQPAARYFRQF